MGERDPNEGEREEYYQLLEPPGQKISYVEAALARPNDLIGPRDQRRAPEGVR